MAIQQLEQAHELYEQIKKLESEMIVLHEHAAKIAEGNDIQNLTLSIESRSSIKAKKESVLDSDGSIKSSYLDNIDRARGFLYTPMSMIWGDPAASLPKKKENVETVEYEISTEISLQIIGSMIGEKDTLRKKLISKIERIK